MKKAFYIVGGCVLTCLLFGIIVAYRIKKPLVIAERSARTKVRFLPLTHWGFYSEKDEGKPSLLTRWGLISQEEVRDTPFDGVHSHGDHWYTVYCCFDVYTPQDPDITLW